MKKWTFIISISMVFVLALSACTAPSDGDDGGGTPAANETFVPGEPGGVDQPLQTQQLATPTMMSPETLEPGGALPGSGGAQVIPATGGQSLNQLSTLMGYQVIDRDGALIGLANDFIINMCEAHLLYILVDVDPALQTESTQALIPYELVTTQNGTIDGVEQTIQINIYTTDLNEAPAYDRNRVVMIATEWETDFITFWSGLMTQSLTTECRFSAFEVDETIGIDATPVVTGTVIIPVDPTPTPSQNGEDDNQVSGTRLILASELLRVEVEDGAGERIGQVVDAVLVPETGSIRYAAVSLSAEQQQVQAEGGLILVPVQAINVRYQGQNDFNPRLALLVDREVLFGAPTITALAEIDQGGFNAEAYNYWSQYVPLMETEQPHP